MPSLAPEIDKAISGPPVAAEFNTTYHHLAGLIKQLTTQPERQKAVHHILIQLCQKADSVILNCIELIRYILVVCDTKVYQELCCEEFILIAQHILLKNKAAAAAVKESFKELLQQCLIAFCNEAYYGTFYEFYLLLKKRGVRFHPHDADQVLASMKPSAALAKATERSKRRGQTAKPMKKVTFSPDPPQQHSLSPKTKEEVDLMKAIQLSLKDIGRQEAEPKPGRSCLAGSKRKGKKKVYPNLADAASSALASAAAPTASPGVASSTAVRQVRAQYDFEAVESNELSFKAGELINIVDDSDDVWWKGTTLAGTGLFPANFVTRNLKASPEQNSTQSSQAGASGSSGRYESSQPNINEEKVDLLLEMLRNADATIENEQEDKTIKEMEDECMRMKPLITGKIDAIDAKRNELQQLNQKFQAALSMYQQYMQEVVQPGTTDQAQPAAPSAIPASDHQPQPQQQRHAHAMPAGIVAQSQPKPVQSWTANSAGAAGRNVPGVAHTSPQQQQRQQQQQKQ
eukprot:scpid66968/ scgid24176/ Signal transducing adapter molecule 1